jgi:hypothetical protein
VVDSAFSFWRIFFSFLLEAGLFFQAGGSALYLFSWLEGARIFM